MKKPYEAPTIEELVVVSGNIMNESQDGQDEGDEMEITLP